MKVQLVTVLACLIVAGCAAPKSYTPIGGSKADGTVKLGYEVGPFEIVSEVNEAAGVELAGQRCAAWGYKSAEAFGATQKQCRLEGGYQYCTHTKEFQCLD